MPNLSTTSPSPGSSKTITKQIRTTRYIVHVYSSTTNKENASDKVLRLIKNEISQTV